MDFIIAESDKIIFLLDGYYSTYGETGNTCTVEIGNK